MALNVIAVIADSTHSLSGTLQELIKTVAGAEFLVSNSLEGFMSTHGEDKVASVQVIVVAVFAGGQAKVVADLWPHCPRVAWIHSLAAGVDTLVPCLRPLQRIAQIPVTNAKGAFSRSLAEYSLAAMLHFNKQVPRIQENKRQKVWDKFVMPELYRKTVGFVGFGDIAQTTANLCRAFGMHILALRRQKAGVCAKGHADETFTFDDKDSRLEFFRRSDFVVCSLPGTPETKHFCSTTEFAAMQSTSVFISIGRGICVDEAALCHALKSGGIMGAACDVFETEPLPQESPLWDTPNLLITAHNADNVATYLQDTWAAFDDKLKIFLEDSKNFASKVDRVSLEHGY
eukprot:TRINITY_DN73745_c0_g1_i1.p1 TRINITY_DN73745_c0_g1~~TRINITY_DN73745_c0_g1_i1.p1  ORF type:complete len:344 (-),score=55.84 TRINITY_DN73745_c0_g1_i1:182-1213(-)